MNTYVARTCTEVGADRVSGADAGNSRPLSDFGEQHAYVLLGDPGSGKTTEFQEEARKLDDTAEYLNARDFITFSVDSHPEWRDKTLFIDGLDEIRAGAIDSRTPLDEIRGRLDQLEQPSFRISCREADWLGTNDLQRLVAVSPNSQITVLRLDPLSNEDVAELLRTRLSPSDTQEFMDQAQHRGLGPLLYNPQTLILLADAVAHSDDWPESRLDTFEMACQKMATERNHEHLAGAGSVPAESVLDGAGYLCALHLIADIPGFTSAPGVDVGALANIHELDGLPALLSQGFLERALKTRLFTGADEAELRPLHRHIAEFLGGRYLAKLIDDDLPASRVMALMTRPSDGLVATTLRGLSAWLAAHSSSARNLLIDADPVGVGLYGDIGGFSTDEKKHLLESLAQFATLGPLFGHEGRDGRVEGYRDNTARAFRSLASADTADSFKKLIKGQGSENQQERVMEFVLRVLSEAETSELEFLADLESDLEAILRGSTWPPHVRESALKAYLHINPDGDSKAHALFRLLEDIHNRQVSDPDDDLCGDLLRHLYPTWLPPSQVWRYAAPRNRPNYLGHFARFWHWDLLEQSSNQHIADLLESLCGERPQILSALEQSGFEDLPLQLLDQGLEAWGDSLESTRLYDWLNAPRRSQGSRARGKEAVQRTKAWLEAHPQAQKAVFLTWIRRHETNERFEVYEHWSCNALHWSKPPADFGLWCLDMAVELVDAEPFVSQELLRQAYRSLDDPSISEGLTLETLESKTRENAELARQLDQLRNPPPPRTEASEWKHEMDDRLAKHEEERRQQQAEWAAELHKRATELWENRVSPQMLNDLAKVYFALFIEVDESAPPDHRISDFIGGDPQLVDAVFAALRGAVFRDELPEASETISLRSESRHSWLAYPVLASMELLYEHDPSLLDGLDDAQKRKALAIHYCVLAPYGHKAATPCHDQWLKQHPDLVLDVLYQCAAGALKAGEDYLPGLNDLDRVAGLEDRVHSTRIRLLRAFPVRAPSKQLPLLDRLLGQALRLPDTAALSALVEKKLGAKSATDAQRVRWLAVGALLSPSRHRQPLRDFVGYNNDRARHLAEFLSGSSDGDHFGPSVMGDCSEPALIRDVIEMLGRIYAPLMVNGFVTLEVDASDRIASLIALLGSMSGNEAHQALTSLVADPQLREWQNYLQRKWESQRALLGDASYVHPDVEQVQQTLSNGLPANAGDLAALVKERLCEISLRLRGDSSNPWRQFWNEDSYGRPTSPKPEESCRDAVLALLQNVLPTGVDVVPEGRYAAGTRADIRVSYGGHNIPIELKKENHPYLWTALRPQLIGQYTTDQATDRHGIYLPLWFGRKDHKPPPPPSGRRPTTAAELERRLEQDLTPEEAHKISVLVLDVTKPGIE